MTLSERIARRDAARPARITRKGVTYVACDQEGCRYVHLMIDGYAYAEWTHPRAVLSPFTRRALAGQLPPKVTPS